MTPNLLTAMSTLTETENKKNNIQISKQSKKQKTKQNKNKSKPQKTNKQTAKHTQKKNTVRALQPRSLARIQH